MKMKSAVVELERLDKRLGTFLDDLFQDEGDSSEAKFNQIWDWLPSDSTIRDLVAATFGPEWAGYLGDRLNRFYGYAHHYKYPGPQLCWYIEPLFEVAAVRSAIRVLLKSQRRAKPGGRKSSGKRKRNPRTMPTPNELRVLELDSQSFSDRQIAKQMGITAGRVSQLRTAAMKRNEAPSRSIPLSEAVTLMDHDGTAPTARKRTRRPKDD